MKLIYEYSDYRIFLKDHFNELPKAGYGQLRKLAEHLGVHGSLISQIFSGQKNLSNDHAAMTAEYLGLSPLETDYFLALVQLEKAATEALRKISRRLLQELKQKAGDVKNQISFDLILSEEHRATFYSSWAYSAVRQACAIGEGRTLEELAQLLTMSKGAIKRIVDFLLLSGLCVLKNHKIAIGPASTYIGPDSPWIKCHHRNWRDRGLISIDRDRDTSFHLSSPMTLSSADAARIRLQLIDLVVNVNAIVDPSNSEVMRCLSIDWFDPL